MSARRLLAVATAFAALGVAPRASAYCIERTCGAQDPTEACEYDEIGCVASGAKLRWASSCLSFDVQLGGSPKSDLDADRVAEVAKRAFAVWEKADCGGRHPSLKLGTFGPVACDESRYNENGKNANIILFHDDDWPYVGMQDTFGQTTVRFDTRTGEIFDADVEINSFDFDITTDGGGDGADLQSILTHEFGHFLGMAHAEPGQEDDTMRRAWDGMGLDLRTLTDDDEAGICALYPPDRGASTSCEPRHGFSGQCFEPIPAPAKPSCSSAAGPVGGEAGGALLFGLAASALSRRRGRGIRPCPPSRACRGPSHGERRPAG